MSNILSDMLSKLANLLPRNILVICEASIFRRSWWTLFACQVFQHLLWWTHPFRRGPQRATSFLAGILREGEDGAKVGVVFFRDTGISLYKAWFLKVKIHGPGGWAPTCPSGTGMEKRPLYLGKDLLRWPSETDCGHSIFKLLIGHLSNKKIGGHHGTLKNNKLHRRDVEKIAIETSVLILC